MCESTHAALIAGTPPDAAHLADCAACRALVSGIAAPADVVTLPVPSLPRLRALLHRRAAVRVGALALAAALLLTALPREPEAEPDLLAVLDHQELEVPGTETLAMLDPFAGDDPLADDDFDDLFPGGD